MHVAPSKTSDSMVNIASFNMYRHDHGHGGGVCIYIRNEFKATKSAQALIKSKVLRIYRLQYNAEKYDLSLLGAFINMPIPILCLLAVFQIVIRIFVCVRNLSLSWEISMINY